MTTSRLPSAVCHAQRGAGLLLLSLLGCVVDAPLPDLGPCADYPDGVYEYGEIGIGSCLSGPTEIRFAEDDSGALTLLVTNANPYLNFTGGSLLAIPWDSIDLTTGRNVVTDLPVTVNNLPSFAGPLSIVDDDLAMVGVRFSEDGRTRVYDDAVHLFDISDPAAPVPSDRGPGGADTITVESDPVDIAYDPATGYAFVANRTDHTISVIDTNGDELAIIQPWPTWAISASAFDDADGSGSTGELADLSEVITTALIDESWTLTWIEGTWRLWLPEAGGLRRLTTAGDGVYTDAAELELDPEDDDLYDEIIDPHYLFTEGGQLYFTDGSSILTAAPGAYSTDWGGSTELLAPTDEGTLNGPAAVVSDGLYWLFFGEDSGETGDIRLALSGSAAGNFSRQGTIIEPTHAHEGSFVGQPHVAYDSQTDQWRMFYSAFDGSRWTIGHAVSDDLLTWTTDDSPVLAIDGEDVGAPAVSFQAGGYRMWFSRGDGAGGWTFWSAESRDGLSWTVIEQINDDVVTADLPARAAMLANPTGGFRVSGETLGTLSTRMFPGSTTGFADYGWQATPLAGMWLSTGDAGADSTGGIRLDSIDDEAGQFWTSLTTSGGLPSIGTGYRESDGSLTAVEGSVFDGSGSNFDQDGASSPVVWDQGGTYYMAYGAHQGDLTAIGLATSSDGLSWSPVGQILDNNDSWDSVSAIPGSVDVLDDGSLRLWYSAFDGSSWRIGALLSDDGESWSRESSEPLLLAGSPGAWDDSGVRHPYVITDSDGALTGEPGEHMWYSGFDGDIWRIGYAFRADGTLEWFRAEDPLTELKRPVIDESLGLFHAFGVQRPVVSLADGVEIWYAGLYGEQPRVGRAFGVEPDRLYKTPRRPTAGDTLTFQTQRGDEDTFSIPLDNTLPDANINGVGLTALDVDEERGFLYASSKLRPYITVIDIRDDSTEDFDDLNYLDVEAVLSARTFTPTTTGFRQVVPMPGLDTLYALNDAPESIMILDVSALVDDAYSDVIYDVQIGWLPTPTSSPALDAGVQTRSDVGPAQLAVHPDGQRLFVTNFNANSLTVYDLRLGPYGTLIGEVPLVGENPYALELTPDGNYAVFGNFTGEVTDTLVESTIGVLDIDPDSPTYLSVLTWVANR